ncbi:MAG: RNA polymerase sigma factor SigJ [Candidatus Dormibacterales bacterium]
MTLARPEGLNTQADPRFEQAWTDHRRHLLNVAYRLVGSVSDAEDAVQEAYARLLTSDVSAIDDFRGWLTTVVSRICLDQLRSARARREAYIGPWYPEPLVEGADPLLDPIERITLDDSVRMAMLIVLEQLSPAERVVFVLHDVFQFPFEDVARMVDRTPAACRQLASRARRHVQTAHDKERFRVDPAEQRRVAEQFIEACASGEMASLVSLLDRAVAGWADLGGEDDRVREPVTGPSNVARRLMAVFGPASNMRVVAAMVNGEPGILALRDQTVRAVLILSVAGGLVTKIESIVDPRKLRHLAPMATQP